MDKKLAQRELPLLATSSASLSPSQPATPMRTLPPLASFMPKNRRVPTRVGKGSPAKPRKANVSKWAECPRLKRKAELQSATHNSPLKRKGPETSSAGSSSSPTPPPVDEITQETPTEPPVAPEPVAPEQLGIQMQYATAEKRVKLFQEFNGSALDEVPCKEELRLFHDDMENWKTLEPDMVAALRTIFLYLSSLSKDPDNPDFLNVIILLHNLTNDILNCTNHMIGYLVRCTATVEENNV